MIATGGLLRINARRQDSLRSKTRNPNAHKKKAKKKRRNEVVVVKGKLKLCSVSGLVAGLGVMVLMVGVIMAALGYWPREGLFFSSQPQEGTTLASVSANTATRAPNETQGEQRWQEPEVDGGKGGADDEEESDDLDETESFNGTTQQARQGFLEEFLDRYLYSDRLKVFGPLIMGIGIFLFICANAVLHENRDKKTKVINLRDIYSTVIDLHSLRRPAAARRSSLNPLNGLVNYVQSKSLEAKPRAPYAATLLAKRDGGGGGGGMGGEGKGLLSRQQSLSSRGGGSDGGEGGEGDSVFSIYQEHLPDSTHRLSLPPGFSPTHHSNLWSSMDKEAPSSFTLPLRRPRPPAPQRRHSTRGWTGSAGGHKNKEEEGDSRGESEDNTMEEEVVYVCSTSPLSASTPSSKKPQIVSSNMARSFQKGLVSCSTSSLQMEVPEGSQAMLLLSSSSLTPSHLSFSSLSHLLSATSSTPPVQMPLERCRRRSLPTAASSLATYIKLHHAEAESFESSEAGEMTTSCHATSQRRFSNMEKLRMISQADCGLQGRGEEEEDRLTNRKPTQ
ncbi:uncharacterized protein LOC143006669 [Genypterus blacodes]|uniref:uncharacterized protein LOC143006669 n=1 Tax=Genypterus blacodes TaxID=154954 RepID=UPI003F75E456